MHSDFSLNTKYLFSSIALTQDKTVLVLCSNLIIVIIVKKLIILVLILIIPTSEASRY